MLKLLLFIVSCFLIACSQAGEVKNIVAKIGDELRLYQDENPHSHWYRNLSTGHKYLGYEDIDKDIDREDYAIQVFDEGKRYRGLIIKKSKLQDAGRLRYYANLGSNVTTDQAKFNIYLFNKDSKSASLIIDSKQNTLKPVEINKIDLEIDSFSDKEFDIKFQAQALPLDQLIVNGKPIEPLEECQDPSSIDTRCLIGSLYDKANLIECTKSIDYKLELGIADPEVYSNLNELKQSYQVRLNFKFPPKMMDTKQTWVFAEMDKEMELVCQFKCANPSDKLEYEWKHNGDRIASESNSNKLKFKPQDLPGFQSGSVIVCTASNGIKPSDKYLHESQTSFKILIKETITTTTPTITTSQAEITTSQAEITTDLSDQTTKPEEPNTTEDPQTLVTTSIPTTTTTSKANKFTYGSNSLVIGIIVALVSFLTGHSTLIY